MTGDPGTKKMDEVDEDQKEHGIVLQKSSKTYKSTKDKENGKRLGSILMIYPLGPFATSQNSESQIDDLPGKRL